MEITRCLRRTALLAGSLSGVTMAASFAQMAPAASLWHVEDGGLQQAKWGEIDLVYGHDRRHAPLWLVCKGPGGLASQYDDRSWIFISPAMFGEPSHPHSQAVLRADGRSFTFKLRRYGYMTKADEPSAAMGTQMDDGRAVMEALASAETASIRFGQTERQVLIGRSGRAAFESVNCPDMKAALKNARPLR